MILVIDWLFSLIFHRGTPLELQEIAPGVPWELAREVPAGFFFFDYIRDSF